MTGCFFAICLSVVSAEGSVAIPPPDSKRVSDAVVQWIDQQPDALREQARRRWQADDGSSDDLIDSVLETAFLLSADVRNVIESATADDWQSVESALETLDLPEVASTNVRQFIARMFVMLGATGEAELALAETNEALSADPDALVFLRAVCLHARLDKEAGIPTLDRLLDPSSEVAERYRALARLMKQDLDDLDDNELAQTARQMRDLQKQLQRGKSGKKTQEQEREILQRLDKMIEKLQQQQQQMQAQGGGAPGGTPDKPAEEGGVGGQKAPGEVDRKALGRTDGWGNLPEKARTDARNLINRKFPSHYRRAVEEYLKKLADRPAN